MEWDHDKKNHEKCDDYDGNGITNNDNDGDDDDDNEKNGGKISSFICYMG